MKKLMFVAAAIAAGVAVADVTSANVVGYQSVAKPTGCQYSMAGSMFIAPGAEEFSLADIDITWPTTTAMQKNQNNSRTQSIQFMAAGSSFRLDAQRAYYKCLADGKWYRKVGASTSTDVWIPDPSTNKFAAGTGFLCNFGKEATITFSGEILTGGEDQKLAFIKPTGCQFFIASNVSGRELSLNELDITWPTTTAMQKNQNNSRTQSIQFMASGSSFRLDADRAYYRCLADGKWYQKKGASTSTDEELTGEKLTGVKIRAGEAFLCNFGKDATITIPSAL